MSTTKWPSMEDIADKEAEHVWFRRFALVAVAISTVSLFASVVAVPMIYGYIQALQTQIDTEIGYCRVGFDSFV